MQKLSLTLHLFLSLSYTSTHTHKTLSPSLNPPPGNQSVCIFKSVTNLYYWHNTLDKVIAPMILVLQPFPTYRQIHILFKNLSRHVLLLVHAFIHKLVGPFERKVMGMFHQHTQMTKQMPQTTSLWSWQEFRTAEKLQDLARWKEKTVIIKCFKS